MGRNRTPNEIAIDVIRELITDFEDDINGYIEEDAPSIFIEELEDTIDTLRLTLKKLR